MKRVLRPRLPVQLWPTLRVLRHGPQDPTIRVRADGVWRATRTPAGPGVEHLSGGPHEIHVEAWGRGAEWLIEHSPDLVGARDQLEGFRPAHVVVRRLHRRFSGLRMGRTGALLEMMIPTMIEQRITSDAAHRAYRALVFRYGEPAPGPLRLMVPPDPAVLKTIPYYELHPIGIERNKANAIKHACSYAARIDALVDDDPRAVRDALQKLPLVGAWTAALVTSTALGDADAIEVGDFHLPDTVCWALAGEARGTDERMLELLAPYRGHRSRVARLIEAAGIRAPALGPRRRVMAFDRI